MIKKYIYTATQCPAQNLMNINRLIEIDCLFKNKIPMSITVSSHRFLLEF